jgi:hypothetical protein
VGEDDEGKGEEEDEGENEEEEEAVWKLLKQLFTQNPYNAIISTMLALLLDTVCR